MAQATERERVLVRHYAALTLAYRFEVIYRAIWGSQLGALQFLNEFANVGGCNVNLLRPWYDDAAARHHDIYGAYNFNNWLDFLVRMGLVAKTGNTVTITLTGRELLKYIIDLGLRRYKLG